MAITWRNEVCQEWTKRMQAAGILPQELRRVIIDVSLEDCVKVYTESYGDEKMFDVSLATVVEGAKIVRAEDEATS